MPITKEILQARIEAGETVANVGTWLPCAKRWVKSSVQKGRIIAVQSGYPDGRPAYRSK